MISLVNGDEGSEITDGLIKYLSGKCDIENYDTEGELDDALFYRHVSYAIYVPEGFGQDVMDGKSPEIKVKTTLNYDASLAGMLLDSYVRVVESYAPYSETQAEAAKSAAESLAKRSDFTYLAQAKVDRSTLTKAASFFGFENYTILTGIILLVNFVLFSFRREMVTKRTAVSAYPYGRYFRQLVSGSAIFAVALWAIFLCMALALMGKALFSAHGALFALNSLIMSAMALALAFLISGLVKTTGALNGIVNVIALGTSFMCGAFIPR